jgi:hypothetical protein
MQATAFWPPSTLILTNKSTLWRVHFCPPILDSSLSSLSDWGRARYPRGQLAFSCRSQLVVDFALKSMGTSVAVVEGSARTSRSNPAKFRGRRQNGALGYFGMPLMQVCFVPPLPSLRNNFSSHSQLSCFTCNFKVKFLASSSSLTIGFLLQISKLSPFPLTVFLLLEEKV